MPGNKLTWTLGLLGALCLVMVVASTAGVRARSEYVGDYVREGQEGTTTRVARRMAGATSLPEIVPDTAPRSRFRDCELCSTTAGHLMKLLSYYNPFNARLPKKMIMVARHKEDTSWLDVYLTDIPHIVYQVADTSAKYTTVTNKGNEATPYLQYIIDNYDNLPETIVFSHGHR